MASRILHVVGVLVLAAASSTVWGQNVKITPLGSHAGELCSRDRATIFEDPTGVRILYDAGQSVTGADDARLGTIDVASPLANFIGRKVETIRGKPTGACPLTGNDLIAPFAAPCLATVQTGGTRTVKTANATQAVEITTVPAAHDSTVPRELLGETARKDS